MGDSIKVIKSSSSSSLQFGRVQTMAVLLLLLLALRSTVCVPTHSLEMDRFRNSIDLDAEQTEARYDQEMLSDIINDNDRGELQKKAESCTVDDYKYDHGQKIQRLDPCEICLCIDGEIFCWWKQCDAQTKAMLSSGDSGEQRDPAPANGQDLTTTSSSSITTSVPPMATDGFGFQSRGAAGPQSEAPGSMADSNGGATRLIVADTLSEFTTTISVTSTVAIGAQSNHNPIDGIPKSMLSFPQTPPIMMHRAVVVKPTEAGRKSRGGANRGSGKGKAGSVGLKKGKNPKKLGVSDRKPTVSIASDALPDAKQMPQEQQQQQNSGEQTDSQLASREQLFGGYGFGMIREPQDSGMARSRDHDIAAPQHYIITSSGHVEMFDDGPGGLGGPEGPGIRDVLSFDGRVSSVVAPVESNEDDDDDDDDDDDNDSDGDGEDGERDGTENDGGPVAPAIMLTTNVTQGGGLAAGDGASSTTTTTMPPSDRPSSVIDILNSTAIETDYGEGTNHSELIYPEVPAVYGARMVDAGGGSSSSSSSSSSTSSTPTTTTATTSGTGSASPSGTSASSEQHCIVMGVTYPVGAVLKQETGNCLQCVCVSGPENDPSPRVTCTPLNCPPLILPDILDGAGF
ncbi:mucin-21 [Anopheles darlingi]|uniref:mucin-21 n=1 Tax=Anopheles darlingi TaxID=43151 RepID=UPI0020FFF687|nr:mucin-21 [Anopheles darlingi]